jgi:hypothetical protein
MLRKVLTPIEDDTEDAPWMVMGTPQFHATTDFYTSLQAEMRSRDNPLFVAGMLPIHYYPIPGGRREQLAPDILAAPVPIHDRSSYRVDEEGLPPSFVLEVVSPESKNRDLVVKPGRYERMGVRELALFAPPLPDGRVLMQPPLQGYRMHPTRDEYVHWEADEAGRLYSDVLDLWLVVRDGGLRAQRTDGSWVPTPMEAEERAARLEAEVAHLRDELARRQQDT